MSTFDIVVIAVFATAFAASIWSLVRSYLQHRAEERQIREATILFPERLAELDESAAEDSEILRLLVELNRDQLRHEAHRNLYDTMSRILELVKTKGEGEIKYEFAISRQEDGEEADDSANDGVAEAAP